MSRNAHASAAALSGCTWHVALSHNLHSTTTLLCKAAAREGFLVTFHEPFLHTFPLSLHGCMPLQARSAGRAPCQLEVLEAAATPMMALYLMRLT